MTLLEWATTPIGWFLIGGLFWSLMIIGASTWEEWKHRDNQK